MDIPLADEIRSRVRLRTGIAVILLNCSHTHWAPFTIPWSVQGPRWVTQEGQAWHRQLVATVTEVVAGMIEAASHGNRDQQQINRKCRLKRREFIWAQRFA